MRIDFSKIKLLIVDMDNTLCDTFHTLSTLQWDRVAKAFEKKGRTDVAVALRKNLGKKGFVKTLDELGLPMAEKRFAVSIYDAVDVRSLKLYPDASAILALKIPKVLVTRGEKSLQVKKIAHLGVKKYFEGVYFVPTFSGKKVYFEKILNKYHLKPDEALVIGDRLEEEIKDANILGVPSVLVLRPEWPIRRGDGVADLTVRSLEKIAGKF